MLARHVSSTPTVSVSEASVTEGNTGQTKMTFTVTLFDGNGPSVTVDYATADASATAGIGEEIIFRLFFISFWVWLISYVILRNRGQTPVFWVVTTLSALVFALGHLPSIMILYSLKEISQVPLAMLVEILLLNGVLSFLAAYYWRKYGFLAAVGIHFWADVVWHVIWGAIG